MSISPPLSPPPIRALSFFSRPLLLEAIKETVLSFFPRQERRGFLSFSLPHPPPFPVPLFFPWCANSPLSFGFSFFLRRKKIWAPLSPPLQLLSSPFALLPGTKAAPTPFVFLSFPASGACDKNLFPPLFPSFFLFSDIFLTEN